jgi:predicted nucleotidyltransferase
MEDDTGKPLLLKIVELLESYGVEFIVVGGQAAVLHGSPIPTYDVDLSYRRTNSNLDRLAKALSRINPTLRGAPPDLPFRLDAQSLALGANFTFDTSFGPLDLLGWLEPLGGFDEIARRAETVEVGGHDLRIISLGDLITIKRHIARPKDQAVLVQLEAIQRLREKGEVP